MGEGKARKDIARRKRQRREQSRDDRREYRWAREEQRRRGEWVKAQERTPQISIGRRLRGTSQA